MLFRVLQAVAINSSRVEKGQMVDIDEKLGASIGIDYLEPIGGPVPPIEEKEEDDSVDLESKTKQELMDLAGEAGLSVSGTKADLIERLTLHYQESN